MCASWEICPTARRCSQDGGVDAAVSHAAGATDDGNQDVADLHAREDLLLDYYTRVDGQPGKVRIPIDRAIELIAQRGLRWQLPYRRLRFCGRS